MMFTAFGYGRMAALYPSAGSAYSYVGRGLNPHLGFLAGWAMALDYLIFPIVAIIQASVTIERIVPAVPYPVWVGSAMR
jgi:putrescine importer